MFRLLVLVVAACVAVCTAAPLEKWSTYKNAPDLKPQLGALAERMYGRPDNSTGERVAKYDPKTDTINPEELGSYAAGDILVPGMLGRNGLVATSSRWSRGRIPFMISTDIAPQYVDIIYQAMNVYHELTCVRFVPWNGRDSDYVTIESSSSGCWASVGRIGGRQSVNLQAPACLAKVGTVLHELMHTVGFLHEQNRAERDQYVDILWENVEKGREENFKKISASIAFSQIPYDYESVMHYSTAAFSSNGKPTLRTKASGVRVGQRERMSVGDIHKINMMYKCDGPYSYVQ
ncbi:zinc metalloproteinase nas-4-like [Neocloeon triangulifer]|uniref:zinc metalloproteinase nas-4-like n=1 Tax=Neocloeon triangulifer TaxID=2078957 RepID=UPI00286EDA6B|nr:zinc metalloproteinase nas-4-like [Neocloeon triangulifer]